MHLEATELWGSGALTDAKAKYEAAIAMCPPDHWAVSIYRTAYAGVLAALGLDREARAQCELALELERVSSDDASPSVAIARCFLGQQCVRARDFSAALDTVLPSIHAGARCEALLRSIEAQALAGLGRLTEARASANAAVALATSDKQREGIKHELSTILPGAGP
jgi:predicted RNA polymerase sigma factor